MNRQAKKGIFLIASLLILFSAAWASGADSSALDGANLSLNGTAFSDENADGIFSAGETGLSNVTIRLMHESLEVSKTTTNEWGQYIFDNISPGLYRLEADPILEADQTAPGCGYYEVNLRDMPGFGLDYGFFVPSNLTASLPEKAHSLMRPTESDLRQWTKQYDSAPKAFFLSSDIGAKIGAAPPVNYSLLDLLKYTPSERDQGTCGNCWIWAGTGAMEIEYARQTGLSDRFSVQYMDSSYNDGSDDEGACCGGWLEDFAAFYNENGIIVPWSNANAHYRDGANDCGEPSAVSSASISTSPHYNLSSISATAVATQDIDRETAITNIKNVLLQDRAIWFGFFLPDESAWKNFYNFWGTEPESAVWQPDFASGREYDYNTGGGHAVLCVGYDESDPDNRCWIMLNSWGTTAKRPAGLFRVSMDMDYNCSNPGAGYAFYWMSLDMICADKENNLPQKPITPAGPASGSVGQSLSYATSAADADGDSVRFTFDWGDKSQSSTGFSKSGNPISANHTWAQPGTYHVRAMATDRRDGQSDWSLDLKISIITNSPPTNPKPTAGVPRGLVGKSYSFVGYSTDPDRDQISYIFDWGDGESTKTAFLPSEVSARAAHSWSKEGTYVVKIMATDSIGATSNWSVSKKVVIKSLAERKAKMQLRHEEDGDPRAT
ncbi:MAG: PKD domain-containing protein [Methanothrix sp.]|nr:PKD domain-containing protein [Methanothrix sp.]